MKKPVILTSTSNVSSSKLGQITGDTEIMYSDAATVAAVIQAGGLPLYMPATSAIQPEAISTYLELADGVLLTGSDTDVDPLCYGESLVYSSKTRIDSQRDRTDIELITQARKKRLPILGICKGMQLINVALGGTLYQDIPAQHSSSLNHDPHKPDRASLTHRVRLAADSLLGEIFASSVAEVNSSHRQAIKRLAQPLSSSAVASDGIVEAYEEAGYPFLLGVQFHPELRAFDPLFVRIFERFVAASERYRD